MTVKTWVVCMAAVLSMHAYAGESQVRAAIQAEVQDAFAKGDYQEIEKRYASALQRNERTPSGVFVAEVLRRSVISNPPGGSSAPGRDDYWIPVEHKVEAWAANSPRSVLPAIIQARTYIAHGLSWRGGGYASTVSPEAFAKLDMYVNRAYDALIAREAIGRKDPYWYVQMIIVSRLQSWDPDRFYALVKEATTAFPANYEIYAVISTRLQPRWGGSAEAIAGLADYAVKQSRQTEGESLYARIYWYVDDALDMELSDPSVNWGRISAGFQDILKRYPDNWNANAYALFACKARDQKVARRLLLQVGTAVDPEVWPDRQTYLRCLQAADVKREELK